MVAPGAIEPLKERREEGQERRNEKKERGRRKDNEVIRGKGRGGGREDGWMELLTEVWWECRIQGQREGEKRAWRKGQGGKGELRGWDETADGLRRAGWW